MAETPEKAPDAETPGKEKQRDKEPVAPNRRFSRLPAILVSALALTIIGAVATYTLLPQFNIALPKLSSFAELFPRERVLVPIPDPQVSAALKEIQLAQQRNAAALQENGAALLQNTAILQQSAATLESLRQRVPVQQTNLKVISGQLSSLIARVDSLQNAVTPLTTSSIPQPNRARFVRTSRKKTIRLPDPVGPVSVGGAPLKLTLGSGTGYGPGRSMPANDRPGPRV